MNGMHKETSCAPMFALSHSVEIVGIAKSAGVCIVRTIGIDLDEASLFFTAHRLTEVDLDFG